MTSSLSLHTHTFSPLFDALLAGPGILAFAILLSTSFATQLDELWSPSNMNTLFASRNTPRARPLILTLPKTPPVIRQPRRQTTYLLIIPTAILTSQLGTLVLLTIPKDKHGRDHIGAHPRRDLLLHALLVQFSTSLTRFSAFATNARFTTTLASVDTLIDGVSFLDTRATGPRDKERRNRDFNYKRHARTRGVLTLHRHSGFYRV